MDQVKLCIVFTLLILVESSGYTQSISGRILSSDSLPISKAHIFLKNGTGTISNKDGNFKLSFDQLINDTIIVSCLGFKTKIINLSVIENKVFEIFLIEDTLQLNAVTVVSKDAEEIVKKAIEKLSKNYSEEKQLYDIYYKEIRNRNDTAIAFLEVSVDLISEGFSNKSIGSKDYNEVFIKGKRVGYNYDPQYTDGNGLFVVFWLNWARGFLSKKALKTYSCSFEGMTSFNDQDVYKILVKQPSRNSSTFLYILTDSYAIVSIEYKWDNSKQKYPQGNKTWWFLDLDLQLTFQNIDDSWFVHTIHDNRKTKDRAGNISEAIRIINVLNVKNWESFPQKHRITPETNLFNYPLEYNTTFWSKYNAPLETIEEKEILVELAKDSINQQNP